MGLAAAPCAIIAQEPASTTDVNVRDQIAAALFTASATQAAAARANVQIRQQEDEIHALRAQLDIARSGRDDDVARLQAELTAAEERFVTALAEQDGAYAAEIAVFRDRVEDIASSPEGVAALARFNAGDELGALEVLGALKAARRAAREAAFQRRADIENAADARGIATLALEARNSGKLSTTDVIGHFEEATALDPDVFWDWVELSRLYSTAGNLSAARGAAEQARETARTDRDSSVAFTTLGDVLLAQEGLPGALENYRAALSISQTRAASDTADADWQQLLSTDHERVGDVLQAQGDLAGGLEHQRAALEITQRLAQMDPNDQRRQLSLSISHYKVGDALSARGDSEGALESYEASQEILERLTASDPGNAHWQRELALTHERIGGSLRAQRDISGALERFEAALEIVQRIAAADPGNADWQRDLHVLHNYIGDVLELQEDSAGAAEARDVAMEIIERLAEIDPGNARWQRDLSISLDRLGSRLAAQGDLAGAFERYRTSLDIRRRLAEIDPSNTAWQRGLFISHGFVGDVLQAREDLSGALEHRRTALEISLRLAEEHPDITEWQRDLIVSYVRMQMATGDTEYAERALEVALRMQAQGMLEPRDEWMIEDLRQRARP
jgi:tetratricopeptide (TPR) repeat protein